MRPLLLKLHRWIALTFAIPLALVILSGVVLSFEPWALTRAVVPGTLSAERIQGWLKQYDPDGKARAIVFRSYDHTLTLSAGRGGGVVVDTLTGERLSGPSTLATIFGTARGLHERLLVNAEWIVVAATSAMLSLVVLGVLMGWPRLANTLAGWHQSIAWGLVPLIALSPLTGLLMAGGITLSGGPPPAAAGASTPLPLSEAVEIVGRHHDLASLVWLRPQGPRMLVRVFDGGEASVFAVAREGTTRAPRNWPRLWHEGNFAGAWSAAMNLVVSVAMAGLLVTGGWLWWSRRSRLRAARKSSTAPTKDRVNSVARGGA